VPPSQALVPETLAPGRRGRKDTPFAFSRSGKVSNTEPKPATPGTAEANVQAAMKRLALGCLATDSKTCRLSWAWKWLHVEDWQEK